MWPWVITYGSVLGRMNTDGEHVHQGSVTPEFHTQLRQDWGITVVESCLLTKKLGSNLRQSDPAPNASIGLRLYLLFVLFSFKWNILLLVTYEYIYIYIYIHLFMYFSRGLKQMEGWMSVKWQPQIAPTEGH